MSDREQTGVEDARLPDGSVVPSHTVTISEEAMAESLQAFYVPGATHVVTIRGGRTVKKGGCIKIGGIDYPILAAYDPFERQSFSLPEAGAFPEIKDPIARQDAVAEALRKRLAVKEMVGAQKGRWIKILIAKE